MRIHDELRDNSVEKVTLLLTRSESQELFDSLELLLKNGKRRHEHVSSEDYQKEITIALYEEGITEGFNERCQKLIQEDK